MGCLAQAVGRAPNCFNKEVVEAMLEVQKNKPGGHSAGSVLQIEPVLAGTYLLDPLRPRRRTAHHFRSLQPHDPSRAHSSGLLQVLGRSSACVEISRSCLRGLPHTRSSTAEIGMPAQAVQTAAYGFLRHPNGPSYVSHRVSHVSHRSLAAQSKNKVTG